MRNLKEDEKENYIVRKNITGIKYLIKPTPPYQTDIFIIKDKILDIQYEVYAIDIQEVYNIVEVTKITPKKIISSVKDDPLRKDLLEEIYLLLN